MNQSTVKRWHLIGIIPESDADDLLKEVEDYYGLESITTVEADSESEALMRLTLRSNLTLEQVQGGKK